jgi:hypothetical protein
VLIYLQFVWWRRGDDPEPALTAATGSDLFHP